MYPTNNFSYYSQQQQATPIMQSSVMPQQANLLKGRPVSSFEEARAMTIDFDGSTFFFPDLANKRIYTKQINLDGTASLNMYELKEIPVEDPFAAKGFITREEFEAVIAELKNNFMNSSKPIATNITASTKEQVNPDLSKMF